MMMMCECACRHAHMGSVPVSREEGLGLPRSGVIGGCSILMWVLGTEPSPLRAASTFNHGPISTGPKIHLKFLQQNILIWNTVKMNVERQRNKNGCLRNRV